MDDRLIDMLFEDGLSLGQISRLTGISKSRLFRMGKHKNKRAKHAECLQEQAKELSKQGYTSAQIGSILNVPASTIRSWL